MQRMGSSLAGDPTWTVGDHLHSKASHDLSRAGSTSRGRPELTTTSNPFHPSHGHPFSPAHSLTEKEEKKKPTTKWMLSFVGTFSKKEVCPKGRDLKIAICRLDRASWRGCEIVWSTVPAVITHSDLVDRCYICFANTFLRNGQGGCRFK